MEPLYFNADRSSPMSDKEKESIPDSRFDFDRTGPDKTNGELYRFARGYLADQALVNAVNVALLAGKPLLVTGEPGTGKTQLAYRMGWEFQMPVHKLEVKSTSEAKDLFYNFDLVGHFRSVQLKQKDAIVQDFVTYGPLGQAILETRPLENVRDLLPANPDFSGPRRSIVLIDEVDKAPRDFPNDILGQLEEMYFRIPELRKGPVAAPKHLAPIVVLTSNSEKNLPDAFLRRCVFHHIEFPEQPEQLKRILKQRLEWTVQEEDSVLLAQLLDLFTLARTEATIEKSPSTSELITWVRTVTQMHEHFDRPAAPHILRQTLGLLFKKQTDLQLASSLLKLL